MILWYYENKRQFPPAYHVMGLPDSKIQQQDNCSLTRASSCCLLKTTFIKSYDIITTIPTPIATVITITITHAAALLFDIAIIVG
jgi:hypothetical protein